MTYPPPQQPPANHETASGYDWQSGHVGHMPRSAQQFQTYTQPPRKRRTELVVFLIIAGLAVVGVAVFLIVSQGSDDDPSAAVTAVADGYVAAIKKVDIDALEDITCTKPTPTQKSSTKEITSKQQASIKIISQPRVDGDRASLQIHVTVSEPSTNLDQNATINFTKNDGNWCLVFSWEAASGGRR